MEYKKVKRKKMRRLKLIVGSVIIYLLCTTATSIFAWNHLENYRQIIPVGSGETGFYTPQDALKREKDKSIQSEKRELPVTIGGISVEENQDIQLLSETENEVVIESNDTEKVAITQNSSDKGIVIKEKQGKKEEVFKQERKLSTVKSTVSFLLTDGPQSRLPYSEVRNIIKDMIEKCPVGESLWIEDTGWITKNVDGSGNGTLNLPDGTKAEFKFDKDGNITQIAIEQPDIALAPGWWEGKSNEEIISLLQDLLQQGYVDTVAQALRELITGVVIEEGGKVRVIPGDLERAKTIASQLEGVTIIDMPADTHYVRIVGQRVKTSQGEGIVLYAKDGLAITELDNGRIMFEGKSTLGGSFNVSFGDWKEFTKAIVSWGGDKGQNQRITPDQFKDIIKFLCVSSKLTSVIKSGALDTNEMEKIVRAIADIVDDSETTSLEKEKMIEPLLAFLDAGFPPESNCITQASDIPLFSAFLSIIHDRDINTSVKENLAQELLSRLTSENVNFSNKIYISELLTEIASDNTISISTKQTIISTFISLLKDQNTELLYLQTVLSSNLKKLLVERKVIPFDTIEKSMVEDLLNILKNAPESAEGIPLRKNIVDILREIAFDPKVDNAIRREIITDFCSIIRSKLTLSDVEINIALSLVDIAREYSNLKELIATNLNLSGKQLDIWNDFGILVIRLKDKDFSEFDLDTIYSVLSSLPANLITPVKVIGSSNTQEMMVVARVSSSGLIEIYVHFDIWGGCANYILFHEIGHLVDWHSLTPDQRKEFDRLHALSYTGSGDSWKNFARPYGEENREEDFATMFEAYTQDTLSLLARAKTYAEEDPINNLLIEKVKFMAKLFAHRGRDGKMYTYIYKVENDGTIKRAEVELGSDDLPVIPDNINWETF